MQYTYKFVNGESISVEVSEEMLAVLQDEDRLESNNEQTNSKRPGRFVRLDAPGPDGKPMELVDKQTLAPTEGEIRLEIALSRLPDSQRRLMQAIYFEGIGIVEYAHREGVSHAAVSQRLKTIRKKLKKLWRHLTFDPFP